jgi:hypothetical protein
MTGIRKLLLALAVIAVLFALLKGFSFFDMRSYVATETRDLERNRRDLKKLEGGDQDGDSSPKERERLEMLRGTVARLEESIERGESRVVGSAVSALASLAVGGALFGLFVAAGKTDTPLGKQLARLPAASIGLGLFSIVLLAVFVSALQAAIAQKNALDDTERRLAKAKSTLESIDYDKNGNVPSSQNLKFQIALSTVKTSGSAITAQRGDLVLLSAITAVGGVGTILCVLFAIRAMRRRDATA